MEFVVFPVIGLGGLTGTAWFVQAIWEQGHFPLLAALALTILTVGMLGPLSLATMFLPFTGD